MGMADVVWKIAHGAAQQLGDATAMALDVAVRADTPPTVQVESFLTRYCAAARKPVVLLLDEVDALVGDTLIALLRQLRSGYPTRPDAFPQSLILCGVRNLQDYRIQASSEKGVITGGSAFNIKAKSLRLGDFIRPEVEALLLEHTAETEQRFTPEALALVWELTQGQPDEPGSCTETGVEHVAASHIFLTPPTFYTSLCFDYNLASIHPNNDAPEEYLPRRRQRGEVSGCEPRPHRQQGRSPGRLGA